MKKSQVRSWTLKGLGGWMITMIAYDIGILVPALIILGLSAIVLWLARSDPNGN